MILKCSSWQCYSEGLQKESESDSNRSPIQNYLWLLPRIHCVLSSTLPPSILGSNDKHLPRIRRWTNRAQDKYLQGEGDGDCDYNNGNRDDGDDGLG